MVMRAIANDRYVRVSGWGVRLGWRCSSGCSFGCTSIRRTPQTDTLLPARGRDLALRLALRKGVPASPLRSNPGTPFLDPPHHRCFGGARRRAWEGSERAAGWKWRTTTRRAGRPRWAGVGGGGRTWVVGAGVFGGGLMGRLRRQGDGITWGMAVGGLEAVLESQELGGQVGCRRCRLTAHWEHRGVAGRGCFLVRW